MIYETSAKIIFCLLIITFLTVLLNPGHLYAEFLSATKQDELILVSTEQEVRMGKSIAKSAEKRFKLASDELLQKKVDEIGQRIVKTCDRKDITYHFKVLAGESLKPEQKINAFALPGGYIYVFEDLVHMFNTDNQIAAVLAHEIGHIAAKHNIKRLQASLGATALKIITSHAESDRGTKNRADVAIGLMMMAYSREDEFMADRLGVKYMKLAGYDPAGSVEVIDKMIELQRKAPLRKYTGFRSHPYLAERKAVVRKEIHGQMEFVDFINLPQQD